MSQNYENQSIGKNKYTALGLAIGLVVGGILGYVAGNMIVFVGAGRSNPGDRIQVDSVGFRMESNPQNPDREIEVVYFVVRTTLEADPFPGESFPIEIVRVDRSERPVRWEERRSGG